MEACKYHVYICDQSKPEGVPCCSARGSEKVIDRLRKEIVSGGLSDKVQVTVCGSLGLCERGPNMVVYPDGIWYSGLTPENIVEIVSGHLKSDRPVEKLMNKDSSALKVEIELNKAKMLAGMKARDESGVLPDDLMQTIRGFQESRVILTAVELDIFSAVDKSSKPVEIAGMLKTDPRATETFLNALVSLGLLHKKDGEFSNTPISSRYLVDGAPDDSRASLMHTVHLWNRWSTLSECVRKGTSVTYSEMSERGEDWTNAFIAAMHKDASARAAMVVDAVKPAGVRKMLDVGGGSGAYSIAFAKAERGLHSTVFDLPTVTPITRRHIEEAGLSDRVTTRDGDMLTNDFGSGYDLVFISAICHMFGPDDNLRLFERCRAALSPEGKIVIQDFILDPNKTSPKTAALFALNMLVGTREGSSYSEKEYSTWLNQTGFKDIESIKLPGPTGLITAVIK